MLFKVKRIEAWYRGEKLEWEKYIRGESKKSVEDYVYRTYGRPNEYRYEENETYYTFERVKVEKVI